MKKDLAKRVPEYLKENQKLLNRLGLAERLVVHFPRHWKAPLLSRLAIRIVARQGGIIEKQFSNK